MYTCFEGIPLSIRQQAFDRMLECAQDDFYGDSSVRRFIFDGEVHCPWGVINSVIEPGSTSTHLSYRIPDSGIQQIFLELYTDCRVQARDIAVFMHDVDWGRFKTLAALAAAMGVNYNKRKKSNERKVADIS